ncbi:helix-turn-helix transcriptional regulator [Kribbella shirazensis]|uniref:DNA-binding CsgD family transcriptional regulator n=1 Tax=Kribbella shirazensis TaxID=1105143 RepID=A0A7X5VFM5_9ACTN|nr:LuxR family transcriptional regulator [Kribbella shirazensis]NIK59617.1 DNA-binding CsgD family transcriptional regulator [Kribbella shirazensis]
MADSTAGGLRGRRQEVARLRQLLTEVGAGQGQALIVRGEPGIGKSALLDYLAARADGYRVVRASGVEAEMELPFAGLHQLCVPMLNLADRLSPLQREALDVAFGLRAGPPPDRFLVGAATLTLLSEASVAQPLMCVVDDGQWLDQASAQALTFAARRLFADRVGVVFGVRDPVTTPEWRGLPELVVRGLGDHDAKALLEAVIPGRLDAHVEQRIVAETRGNPLALLELPRGLTAAELAGGFERPDVRPLASQLEQTFARRMQTLPPETQQLLLTAAAEPVGDVPLLLRALRVLGVPVSAAGPAEAAGLIEIGARVTFRHPLVRSATYREAASADRRAVHQALAEATDPTVDPDRRAWHRANGAADTDEDIAAELVASADRAQRRGGLAATAAFLYRATHLTPDPATRAARALAAAHASLRAGAFENALKLLVVADDWSADDLHQAMVALTRAQVTFVSGRSEAVRLLLDAARRLEPLAPDLARDTYVDAISAAMYAGILAPDFPAGEVARAALAAPRPPAERKQDLLLDTLAVTFTDGYPAAVALAKDAVQAFADPARADPGDQRWLFQAARAAIDLRDLECWDTLTARHESIAREQGDLTQLPLALTSRMAMHAFSAEFTTAASLRAEVRTICDVTGVTRAPYGEIPLTVMQGRVDEATRLIAELTEEVMARGEGAGLSLTYWARAFLMNSLARYSEALEPAQAACADPSDLGLANWVFPELVEAAVRTGQPELASEAHDRLTRMMRAAGTDWALGVLARSSALLATGKEAEACYREAVERLGRTRVRIELARAHLLYGEWLRREGRRQDARGQLRTAYDILTSAGSDAFTERLRHELAATGETVGRRADRAGETLTAQEARIAELAANGLTNAEIGAQMFLSGHTIEWHLRKVFTKLGISSRRQLRTVLAETGLHQ